LPDGIAGPDIGELPAAPAATSSPTFPTPDTATRRRQFLTAVLIDDQKMWARLFAQAGVHYRPARLAFFTSTVHTSCGPATSEVGPFYCPADHTIYLDTRFFDVLERQFGVKGDFAQAYVVAHEIGHHVQTLLGVTARVAAAERTNPSIRNTLSVRVELQADCFAGIWAHSTYERRLLESGDLKDALTAAATAGDDFLQHTTTGQVVPETFTHGTSAQRVHWLTVGFESGQPAACDTFGPTA
jgi:predicted metalloprotease